MRTYLPLFVVPALFSSVISCAAAFADGDFRCPKSGKIVHEGENQYEVVAKCGDPAFKSPISVTNRDGRGGERTVEGEEWTYDFGPNAFTQKLRFEGSALVKITRGDYGTRSGASNTSRPVP